MGKIRMSYEFEFVNPDGLPPLNIPLVFIFKRDDLTTGMTEFIIAESRRTEKGFVIPWAHSPNYKVAVVAWAHPFSSNYIRDACEWAKRR